MTVATTDRVDLFVPGRLCLFGEHSDWAAQYGLAKGYCLVIGTDQGLRATAAAADDFRIDTALPTVSDDLPSRHRSMRSAWNSSALREAAEDHGEFFRYCAGVAFVVKERFDVGGLDLRIHRMDLPLKKGVSSSAAVCVLVASAFDRVYDLGLFPHEIMELAYLGERQTGSRCGRMDQACFFGKTPVLLTFGAGDQIRVEPVFPSRAVSMLLVDLAGRKDTIRILSDLRQAYSDSPALQDALGAANERMVRRAYRALSAGDAEALGACMTEAQALFDRQVAPHSSEELASPLLHEVLALEAIQPHIHGGKGVGSQGDGTAQLVLREPSDAATVAGILQQRFPDMRCFGLSIVPAGTDPQSEPWTTTPAKSSAT
ncbi:MAG: GHMP kinase [Planctomycetes bacterium]|nr:GHMP kinase [Planctomycetota bacterium]